MKDLALFLSGAASGAVAAAAWIFRRWTLRYDIAALDLARASAFRARQVWADRDHHARLSRRRGRALAALRRIDRVVIGDLLDKVAQRDRVIAELRGEIDRLTRPRHLRPARRPAARKEMV